MTGDEILRTHVLDLLRGEQAHMPLDTAVADLPMATITTMIPRGTYTPWHLLEHVRLAQRDILNVIADPHYREVVWPDDAPPADSCGLRSSIGPPAYPLRRRPLRAAPHAIHARLSPPACVTSPLWWPTRSTG